MRRSTPPLRTSTPHSRSTRSARPLRRQGWAHWPQRRQKQQQGPKACQHHHLGALQQQQRLGMAARHSRAQQQQQQQVACRERVPCCHPLSAAPTCHPHQHQQQLAAATRLQLHRPMCHPPHLTTPRQLHLHTCRLPHQASPTCRHPPPATRCPPCPPTRPPACPLLAWHRLCRDSPSSDPRWKAGGTQLFHARCTPDATRCVQLWQRSTGGMLPPVGHVP